MLWSEKHRPKFSEFYGNEQAVEEIKKWALDWQRGKAGKPLLIHGPAGVGKSALAHALAENMGWEIVEMNASQLRDKEHVLRIAGSAASSGTLSGKRRLILIDEIDGLQSADRGGESALASVLRQRGQPIIATANDYWNPKLSVIRQLCTGTELKKASPKGVASVLKRIANKEGIKADDAVLEKIAKESGGDIRSAVNDLHALCEGRGKLSDAECSTSSRDREKNIFDSLRQMFKASNFREARSALSGVDVDSEFLMKWIEENIANEYEDADDISAAFDRLSRADVFYGRIRKRQCWDFLKYVNDLMGAGIALSKKSPYRKFTKYSFPKIVKSMSASREQRALRNSIGRKIGRMCHVSSRDAAALYIPLFREISKKQGDALREYLSLTDEEMDYLKG